MRVSFIVVLIILAVLVVVQFALATNFGGQISAARDRLLASQKPGSPDQTLIPPIIRAFAARAGGQLAGPATIALLQSAEMKLAPEQPFMHIDATQLSGTRDPGFVWHAWGNMGSFIPVVVVDSYVGGEGWLEARIAGAIPVAKAKGVEASRGEAMRFLAELPWNPDALINARGLSWRQLDEHIVEVSLATEGGPARVRLLFDPAGDIVGAEADDRLMAVGTQSVPTPWIGRFSNYTTFGGYRMPRHGEVAWMLPEGEFVYWRGDILSVTPAVE
jgi:hypothetical protein